MDMKAKFAIVIILYALMGLATSAELSNQSSEVGEPSVEELAIRFLQESYSYSTDLIGVQLLPGKLPQEMPVDLPIPDGTRTVGSMIQEDTGFSVVLDVPMTPDQALEFYRERLASQNWTEVQLPGMNQGFVEDGDPSIAFCKDSKDPWMIIVAHPEENGTDLRVSISNDTDCSPCSLNQGYDDWLKPIPKLAAPKGARISNENSVSGPGNMVATSVTVKTEMNSSSLTAHYADQLMAANWTIMGEGESGPSSWSSWSYNDEDGQTWDGFLMALELPGTDETQRFVLMQANLKEI